MKTANRYLFISLAIVLGLLIIIRMNIPNKTGDFFGPHAGES